MREPGRSASEILAHARRSARKQDEFERGSFHFVAVWDHILESQCVHGEEGDSECCRSLNLPELPEMVFPNNTLTIKFTKFPGGSINFNALDALKMVSADTLPDVQVAPSSAWQESRRGIVERTSRPFDWTFTSRYAGTIRGCTVEATSDTIDMERLKQQEPIGFYSQITLYEDELADHGTAQMSVRVRVMPGFFFVLMRFYLRIDRVLVRVCDTRLVGDNDANHVIREWSLREAKVSDLEHLELKSTLRRAHAPADGRLALLEAADHGVELDFVRKPPEVLLDGNQVWASLPILELRNEKIVPNTVD